MCRPTLPAPPPWQTPPAPAMRATLGTVWWIAPRARRAPSRPRRAKVRFQACVFERETAQLTSSSLVLSRHLPSVRTGDLHGRHGLRWVLLPPVSWRMSILSHASYDFDRQYLAHYTPTPPSSHTLAPTRDCGTCWSAGGRNTRAEGSHGLCGPNNWFAEGCAQTARLGPPRSLPPLPA